MRHENDAISFSIAYELNIIQHDFQICVVLILILFSIMSFIGMQGYLLWLFLEI